MSDLKALARELYDLEQIYRQRALDADQARRWQELAKLVFSRARDRRRSSRIAGAGKAKLRVANKESTFDVVDVSWGGLGIKGRGADNLGDGAEAELVSVFVDGEWIDLTLGFKVVRQPQKNTAALQLIDLDTPRRQRFFEKAYYPMYLGHLKALAEIT